MWWRVVCGALVVAALGCGDDDAASTDGGTDARPPRRDAGADAGPRARVDLCDEGAPAPGPYPEPGAWTPNRGPGGPARTFADAELYAHCAYLDGGEGDTSDHHNLVVMYDGYLLMPWAPEYSPGGITLWEFDDPCAPVVRGYGTSSAMRESHSIGFSHLNGAWAVVDSMTAPLIRNGGGIQFWDLSDTAAPRWVSNVDLPGFQYPDAYARVTLSVFWQSPYVYVGGADNGIYIVDAADPRNPVYLGVYEFEPTMRVGQVQVVGNLLIATTAEGPRTALLDVSDPERPQPIPGGDFEVTDDTGLLVESYFSNFASGYVYYARKSDGAGLVVWDIRDPTRPVHLATERTMGNGGYVFVQHDHAFMGESSFATIYDIGGLATGEVTVVRQLMLTGDLDTATPIGNVVVLSVDDDAEADRGSAVVPWQTAPDTRPPAVRFVWPADGATGLAPTSRFGVGFDEMVDVRSAWEGSVRLYETGTDPNATRVAGTVSAQETVVNFHPFCALRPGTSYTLEIPAGGIVDFDGNAVAETFTATFTTAGE